MGRFADFANCSMCRRVIGTGDGSCPFRESWMRERMKLDRHECVSFKPIGNPSLEKRRVDPVDQPSLF